jgi:TonB family protein
MGRYSLVDEALTSAESPESPDAVPMRTPEPKIPEPRNADPRERHPAAAAPVPLLLEEPVETSSRNGRLALFATLALAISFGAYLVHARLKPATARASQVRPAGLGMKVDRQGSELLVSWNRQAPEILQAANADFKIMEGARSRVLALSAHELRTGSLLYTANAEDIEMELDVSGPAGDFAESVRVVGANPGTTLVATPILPETPGTAFPPALSFRKTPPLPSPSGVDSLRVVAARPEARPSQTVTQPSPPPPPAASSRAFVPPPRGGKMAARALSAAPEAPVLQAALDPPPALHIGIPSLPSQSLPQADAPPGRLPVTDVDSTPPRAIRSVQPSLGATSTAMERAFAQTDKPHQVQVEVTIDERGAVTNAVVGATTGPFAYLFVDSAIAAARRWQFEPARRGGRPVPGKMTLRFEFVKGAR